MEKKQNGFWLHASCENCNTKILSRYVEPYREFVRAAADAAERTCVNELGAISGLFRPSAVLRQVLAMFALTWGYDFVKRHTGLQEFLLDTSRRELPPDFRLYPVLMFSKTNGRVTGPQADPRGASQGIAQPILGDVSLWPLSWLLLIGPGGLTVPDSFTKYAALPNCKYAYCVLKVRSRWIESIAAGDYQSPAELRADTGSTVRLFRGGRTFALTTRDPRGRKNSAKKA